jgi:hypothetical protein
MMIYIENKILKLTFFYLNLFFKHENPSRLHRRAVDSLFVIAGHGALIQYDLEPRHASSENKTIFFIKK